MRSAPGLTWRRPSTPENGALVTPGTAIATLDDIDRVYVDFPVPETALAVLGEGQVLRGTTAAYPGRTFEGVVSTIDSRVDPATRAVTVRGDFANPENLLRTGMLVLIVLCRPEREASRLEKISWSSLPWKMRYACGVSW